MFKVSLYLSFLLLSLSAFANTSPARSIPTRFDTPDDSLYSADDIKEQREPLALASASLDSSSRTTRLSESVTPSAATVAVSLAAAPRYRISQMCNAHELPEEQCKVKWVPIITQSLQWLAIQHEGNWGMEYWMRYETFHEPYWKNYKKALANWRWTRWNDDDPFLDDYVGHPMMGAITSQIFIQNDPKSATLEFGKSRAYWHSRLVRSFWYSAAYSAQWKIGPASEASLEKVGSFVYYDAQFNKYTNGSGMVDFVVTPVGGTMWLIAEDILDKHVMRRLENVSRNPLWLTALAFMEPCRSTANVLRFKAPWYRDNRHVKAFEKRARVLASNVKP